jgi:UDP-2,3-diacylglucosamine pyrophosphatase LpxH
MTQNDADRVSLSTPTRTLRDDTLIAFLSDTHIGGDPGHDIFETPRELTELLEELSAHGGPVELVLSGDFFDFLEIGDVPNGENRASVTISRPEYRNLFNALRDFGAGQRVIYLPGNHDAEVWWNPAVQKTLREERLVDEFALSYAARFESVAERVIYCEHGNQFDPANIITDYEDPLDTPFGDHIVTDLTRGLVAAGRITRSLDLRDLNKVFPLVTIPEWVVGRFFYDLLGRVVTYLLLPLIVGYAAYWIVEYLLTVTQDGSASWLRTLLAEIATDASLLVIAFALFFLAVRRTAARAVSSVSSRLPGHRQGVRSPHVPEQEIRDLLRTDRRPPMNADLPGRKIDVFVSGHTHAPSLSEFRREKDDAVVVNSGCWLRQLQPIKAHFRSPPVFVPKFVQTHVRVYLGASGVRVELWEHPKPARVRLRVAERIAILGRLPAQPSEDAEPRIGVSRELQSVG